MADGFLVTAGGEDGGFVNQVFQISADKPGRTAPNAGEVSLRIQWLAFDMHPEDGFASFYIGAIQRHTAVKATREDPESIAVVPLLDHSITSHHTPHIDLMPENGKYKGQTLKGVYTLDGDRLVIAFAEPGLPRPEDTEPKPTRVVATHRRAK